MRVDVDGEEAGSLAGPRFQRAPFQRRQLVRWIVAFAVLAACAFLGGLFAALFAPNSLWPALCLANAAAWLLLMAGLQSAYWLVAWRAKRISDVLHVTDSVALDAVAEHGWYERLLGRISRFGSSIFTQIGAPILWLGGLALLALLALQQVMRWDLPATATGVAGSVVGGICLLLAFAMLVLERQLAQENPVAWPEAANLAQLSKVSVAVLAGSAMCLFFSAEGSVWPSRLAMVLTLLPMLLAIEFLLRALLGMFTPQQAQTEPRLLANSALAELLRWPPRPLRTLQDELHNRFGIDLRQIWAFGYIRRAFLPVFTVVLLVGWLLTGIYEIPLQGRGIYERFGEPLTVQGPGLHAGWPWPFGRMLAVENGVVHELATTVAQPTDQVAIDTAESAAPASADRLWDASHDREKSQVIASTAGAKQSFQIVNMDLRFVYRIGLTDQAAMAATYSSADIPSLIRSTASRILVHDFASLTLDDLLGAQRSQLAASINSELQANLDQLGCGVELLATVVEAIHPPAGAANAYHAVQAAQIGAQALIARERGAASEQTNQAQLAASNANDQAHASAQEAQAYAQAADLRFGAERQAYAVAGQAFLQEQYLSQLSRGLSNAKLLILDHRLSAQAAPTIDLRTFAVPADPNVSRQAAP